MLIKAKHKDVPPTSLLVRYGEDKQGYIAELFADEQAPMSITIEEMRATCSEIQDKQEQLQKIVFGQSQDYYTIGLKKQGLTFIVTNILHQESTTYLRVFIENRHTIPFRLLQPSFEYITYLRRFLFFTKEQRELVAPI